MPELGEVEYFRRCWDPGLGSTILGVQLHREKRVFRGMNTGALKRRLVGQKLLRSQTKGKQMLFVFSGDTWLGIHLGMSGTLRTEPAGFRLGKHDHLCLAQRERALVFRDPRQFGRVRLHHGKTPPDWWDAAVPEIYSSGFTQHWLREFLRRHPGAPLKSVLLLQRGFPGIGNWMADEILWRARVAPRRRGAELNERELAAIWRSARFVGRAALRTIGRDNSDLPRNWLLHQRWKESGKCPKHKTRLRRERFGGRTTAWCPHCQR
jgi:formamidopyrimidine-DNA glycosylase